jgi:hypothetical protein
MSTFPWAVLFGKNSLGGSPDEYSIGPAWQPATDIRPDEFKKKSLKLGPNPFFVKINALPAPWKKVAQEFVLRL